MVRCKHDWIHYRGNYYVCSKCEKEKFIKFPVRGQPKKTLVENFNEKTIIWKNMFKMELNSIMLIIIVLALIVGYKLDVARCNSLMDDPKKWCEKSCSDYLRVRSMQPNYLPITEELVMADFNQDDTS